MALPEDIPSLVRALVDSTCGPEVFGSMSLPDQRNLQMLVVFSFLLEGRYANGINALLPAKNICSKTNIGVGWGQIGTARTAIVKAMLYLNIPMTESNNNEPLRRATNLVIDELVTINSRNSR